MEFLSLGPKIDVIPVVHGSGDSAIEARRRLLEKRYDCLAVPLPPSFEPVAEAVDLLPTISVAYQREQPSWSEDEELTASYVPIDPCQPVIAAIRVFRQERRPIAFVDAEVESFEPTSLVSPDPYALKTISLEAYSGSLLPVLGRPEHDQHRQRCRAMATRLSELSTCYQKVVLVCGINDWPWIADYWFSLTSRDDVADQDLEPLATDDVESVEVTGIAVETLAFATEELPFVVGRYEQARSSLDADDDLSVEGLKDLLVASRNHYVDEIGKNARPPSPQLFATFLKYVRNLSLVERRLTPDLYTLVVAARQIMGDTFAHSLITLARSYPFDTVDRERVRFGIDRAELPDRSVVTMKNRLPGPPRSWRSCELTPQPTRIQRDQWKTRWNPFRQCSWPPEDTAIERFRTHVKEHALSLLGNDLARSEKFTTSLKDGLDIRETLRNWHTGDLYVKELPPTVGTLDCVVMLFDSPADPRTYPYRITWHAEHHDESTLGFFATDPQDDVIGPGISRARYGGALFLFPPRDIPEIWRDTRLDFTDTLEERLIAAGCLHSTENHVALLSAGPPGAGWKRLAKHFGKKLIHVPLTRFSQLTMEQLRSFHVLNGQEVRSYAADFIRKA